MPKKSAGYTDCKIYQRKIDDDSEKAMIGIDFGDLRLKSLSKLVQVGDTTTNRHSDAKYLLKKLAELIDRELGAKLSLTVSTVTLKGKKVCLEFPTNESDAGKTKKALLAVLEGKVKLRVVVIK